MISAAHMLRGNFEKMCNLMRLGEYFILNDVTARRFNVLYFDEILF